MQLISLFAQIVVLLLVLVPAMPGFAAATDELNKLVDESWEFDVREDPLYATQAGDHRFNDRLPSDTIEDQVRRLAAKKQFLKRLESINSKEVARADRINYDIFGKLLRDDIAEYEFRTYLMPITNRSGFHINFPELRREVPLNNTEDYENYIARLRAFRHYGQEQMELMREGIKSSLVLPAVVLEGYQDVIVNHIVDNPTKSLLFEPFQKFPDTITEANQKRLVEAGSEAISSSVVPLYRDFLEFMQKEYVPACRGSVGAVALPNGRAFYRHRVRKFTTLDLIPEQVHATGLMEVKRIRAEMEAIRQKVDFSGDLAEFIKYLRSESRFYAQSADQLMREVGHVCKRMDGELPRLFKVLPRTPYGIREIPDYIAPRTTTAYYQPPAGDGTRAGFYYVNTYDLKSRPLFELEALTFHEAVPGHHLQIAMQQELTDLPKYRRFAGFTAFVEGWGLYSERLGLEVGFYKDPYSDFGRLSFEMWRACRLVVDTGIHYLGWSREQAIRFMAENTALSLHNITSEVDRYISWPGQALAYKTGELKIRELRKRAEERLGTRFDVREFHHVVLSSGAVPLTILEDNVEVWISESKDR